MHACPICDASGARRRSVARVDRLVVYRCETCLGETVSPIPSAEELKRGYQDFDASLLARDEFAEYSELAQVGLRAEVKELFPSQPQRILRFLDYGCGAGHYVDAARSIGLDAIGVDVDASAVE